MNTEAAQAELDALNAQIRDFEGALTKARSELDRARLETGRKMLHEATDVDTSEVLRHELLVRSLETGHKEALSQLKAATEKAAQAKHVEAEQQMEEIAARLDEVMSDLAEGCASFFQLRDAARRLRGATGISMNPLSRWLNTEPPARPLETLLLEVQGRIRVQGRGHV